MDSVEQKIRRLLNYDTCQELSNIPVDEGSSAVMSLLGRPIHGEIKISDSFHMGMGNHSEIVCSSLLSRLRDAFSTMSGIQQMCSGDCYYSEQEQQEEQKKAEVAFRKLISDIEIVLGINRESQ